MAKKKVYIGMVWQYDNRPHLGRTWAAEATLKGQGAMVTSYGQKTLKACIAAANKALSALGWQRIYPTGIGPVPVADPNKPYKE